MINVLTRVSRPELFASMKSSIDYEVNHIVYDDTAPRERKPYDWNLFCNVLKEKVRDGHFFYADDDDTFRPGALKELDELLTDDVEGLIVQFLRNGKPKPNDHLIKRGKIIRGMIGGGSLVLHSRHRGIGQWQAKRGSDFDYLKEVSRQVDLKFVPLVLQITHNNGRFGK